MQIAPAVRRLCCCALVAHRLESLFGLRYYYAMRSSHHVATDPVGAHFSDPQLLVLASLADGPKHGHAMLEDIQRMCGSRLGPGTLYGAIARLEQQGLIEPLPVDERRKPYRLTEAGRTIFAAKMRTLQRIVNVGAKRLAWS